MKTYYEYRVKGDTKLYKSKVFNTQEEQKAFFQANIGRCTNLDLKYVSNKDTLSKIGEMTMYQYDMTKKRVRRLKLVDFTKTYCNGDSALGLEKWNGYKTKIGANPREYGETKYNWDNIINPITNTKNCIIYGVKLNEKLAQGLLKNITIKDAAQGEGLRVKQASNTFTIICNFDKKTYEEKDRNSQIAFYKSAMAGCDANSHEYKRYEYIVDCLEAGDKFIDDDIM